MVNWQITATTIYCDAVDDEVTVLVFEDGTVNCTGYVKYGNPNREISEIMKKKANKLNRKLGCNGLKCQRITSYRDRLFVEEDKYNN